MSAQPKPSELQYRDFIAQVREVDDEPNTLVATISTDSVDRMGDVIDQEGWDLASYRKNPVVLWSHDYSIPPIGKAVDVRVINGRLKATTKFAMETQLGREVYALYRGGYMSAFSVGFKPLEWKPLKGPDGESKGLRFLKSELLEYSAVPVPANSDAVVEMRHLVDRGMLAECAKYLPTSVTGSTAEQVGAFATRALRTLDALERYQTIARVLRDGGDDE